MYINNNGVMRFECVDCNQMRWNKKTEKWFCRETGDEVECDYEACDQIEYLLRNGDL